jgi:CheY-like chemotaxis protein
MSRDSDLAPLALAIATLLVVEAEAVVREMAGGMLHASGGHVVTADGRQEALRPLRDKEW